MKAIYLKELKSYFYSMTGYVYLHSLRSHCNLLCLLLCDQCGYQFCKLCIRKCNDHLFDRHPDLIHAADLGRKEAKDGSAVIYCAGTDMGNRAWQVFGSGHTVFDISVDHCIVPVIYEHVWNR